MGNDWQRDIMNVTRTSKKFYVRGSKFGNAPTIYEGANEKYCGKTFDSKLEVAYASYLDFRVRLGEITHWEREPKYALPRTGTPLNHIFPDFRIWFADGTCQIKEVKGREDPTWKIKWNWFTCEYPELEKEIVKRVPLSFGRGG
jgi:Protein of unknown function (DUF1064)